MSKKKTKHLCFSVTIKDCKVQTFTSGGKGGQHQNRTQTGVRIIHEPSGAVGESRSTRSQLRNKREAFRKMAESSEFQVWAKMKASNTQTIKERVDNLMKDENLLVEYGVV